MLTQNRTVKHFSQKGRVKATGMESVVKMTLHRNKNVNQKTVSKTETSIRCEHNMQKYAHEAFSFLVSDH